MLTPIDSKMDTKDKSAMARGKGAQAREIGYDNKLDGFGKGERYRQECNSIIHETPGNADKRLDRAEELNQKEGRKDNKLYLLVIITISLSNSLKSLL